jgi:hypothetical protein
VNVPLTQISIATMQAAEGFAAGRVFPIIPVVHQSDRWYVYTRDAWLRDDVEPRAPATESTGNGFDLDNSPTYACVPYAHHFDVADQIRRNQDLAINLDRDATLFVTAKQLLKRERVFVQRYCSTGIWTGTASGNDQTGVGATPGADQFLQWDLAGSTPIMDVRKRKLESAQKTGFAPNVLLIGPYVANGLINNAEIVDRIKYSQLGFVDYALLAQAFGVDEVVVPTAIYNVGAEAPYVQGSPNFVSSTFAPAFIHSNYALLAYRPPAPGPLATTAGYIFVWRGYLGGMEWLQVKKFRMEQLAADRVESESAFDMKTILTDHGVFFNTPVSAAAL